MARPLAIIVPFRAQRHVNREAQLRRLLRCLDKALRGMRPSVYVVCQSDDGRRFNRGQLLNAGVLAVEEDGGANVICFHDVDLLPADPATAALYREAAHEGPVHIAGGFMRYHHPQFLGGILLMRYTDVLRTNGFPNGLWGWGGEDDALRARCNAVRAVVRRPATAIEDLEQLTLQQKMQCLRNDSAKCPDKRERVAADALRWRQDGINSLRERRPRVLLRNSWTRPSGITVVRLSLVLHGEGNDRGEYHRERAAHDPERALLRRDAGPAGQQVHTAAERDASGEHE